MTSTHLRFFCSIVSFSSNAKSFCEHSNKTFGTLVDNLSFYDCIQKRFYSSNASEILFLITLILSWLFMVHYDVLTKNYLHITTSWNQGQTIWNLTKITKSIKNVSFGNIKIKQTFQLKRTRNKERNEWSRKFSFIFRSKLSEKLPLLCFVILFIVEIIYFKGNRCFCFWFMSGNPWCF